MKRVQLMMLGVALAVVALFAAPAQAQDGPTLTADPATVDAPGEYEFTVTGSGWTAAPPIFVLPCDAPESGEATDIDQATCDTGSLTPANPTDGAFEVTVMLTVPEGGLAIAAGDAASSEAAAVVVTVGAAEEGSEDEGTEATEDTEDGEDEELADTGAESGLLAIVGIAVVAGGAMVVNTSRRN